ncbi:adaptor protein MecA [Bacillus solimangrovi]|uniref:Adapter protein MecA n=1 Tax=Bacillus solimangrovi TaxID=1305675 RepID=A0A1E5LC06_9BACI|nr:adaptor protein MecA [Bacillus solimangrovi]OEH91613.1 adaptor protein MecA [Bacillus solimangrovi]
MEIERINENTVKFYVTYHDIEERGFDREEIWYNRERSEELFWEMMDEVHSEEEFPVEGPLWIQVQALEKGLEVIVTRAQLSKDGQKLELPISEGKHLEVPVDEQIESMLDQQFRDDNDEEEDEGFVNEEEQLRFVIVFNDFEDVIALAYNFNAEGLFQQLYHYDNRYYLYTGFEDERYNDEEQDNLLSQVLEYGEESRVTIHRIEEYGKKVIAENALQEITKYFPFQA